MNTNLLWSSSQSTGWTEWTDTEYPKRCHKKTPYEDELERECEELKNEVEKQIKIGRYLQGVLKIFEIKERDYQAKIAELQKELEDLKKVAYIPKTIVESREGISIFELIEDAEDLQENPQENQQ